MSTDRDQRSARDRARGPGGGERAPTPGKYTNTQVLEGGHAPTPPIPGKRSATEMLPEAETTYRPDAVTERRTLPAAGKGGGNALPTAARAQMEAAFGVDFSAIRIHEDGAADDVDAHAYAQGTDIHFAPGRFDPNSSEGLALLGHELTHVVQQSQGRVQATLQTKSASINDDSALEREADALGSAAARGEQVNTGAGASATSPATAAVQRKVKVNPVASSRHNKLALIGDGTPANPGLTIGDLDAYVTRQADWFSEPSLGQPDRDAVWKVLLLLHQGPHMVEALRPLRAGAVAALAAGDMNKLTKYATCFNSAVETIQVSTPAATLARALQLGQAIIDLEAFVPKPVMRVVIPESGLIFLVDNAKIPELKKYYTTFKPTLEAREEWQHVETLLTETVGKYGALAGWVHDLHIFTTPTRQRLVANVGDTSRAKPVMLVLFSASDWNTAFLQAKNMESAILNNANNALVLQGMTSLAAAAGEVTRVANDYGQRNRTWNWRKFDWDYSPGRLGQVVIAGHGSNQSVEMASPGTNATAQGDNRHVSYDEQSIDSGNPAGGTQLLFDTILDRMDPKDANVVFAGCLVGSHNIPAGTNVGGGSAAAQANLQAALKANPNLADFVRQRMAAKGMTGTVQAANGSTTFDSFNVDATGRAKLSNPTDPHIGGTKLQYVQTGIEPEGALRAALECYADPAIGPAKVTTEIRTRVAGLAGNNDWWATITRLGFEQCLPPAPAEVDVGKLMDVVHRIEAWFFAGWAEMIDVQRLANEVKAAEAPKVFPAMLGTTYASGDHLKVGVPEAWIQHDAGKTAAFLTAMDASSLKRESFKPLLARGIVDPKLGTLLSGASSKGKLLLALTIALDDGPAMPAAVKTFLRSAAGNTTTSSFPAALGVPALIGTGELNVLESIGLAPRSAPSTTGTTTVDGNVDANHNNKNETFIVVSPHEATVTAPKLHIRRRADLTSSVIDTVTAGTVLRVMGETASGWSFVDHNGKTGFVSSKLIA